MQDVWKQRIQNWESKKGSLQKKISESKKVFSPPYANSQGIQIEDHGRVKKRGSKGPAMKTVRGPMRK